MVRASRLVVALALLASCTTNDPPAVVCPTTVGKPIDGCSLAGAQWVVEATVNSWATSSRVVDLVGFPETAVTPVRLEVKRALKGAITTGMLDVLLVGCVGADGTSIQGPLATGDSKSTGFFFVVSADGYNVVLQQGFFRRDGSLLKNPGIALDGFTDADFQKAIHCGDAGL